MNIANLLNTPSLSLPTDEQGPTISSESDAGAFGQILEMIAAEGQFIPVETLPDLPDMPNNAPWPAPLLKIFGQNPNLSDVALDLLQEAPSQNGEPSELSLTLTELMIALQSVVNQSGTVLPTPTITNDETGETSENLQANDEPDLSALNMLAGTALVQPAAAISHSPEFEATLREENIPVTHAPTRWAQPAMPETSSPAQVIRSASEALSGLTAPVDQPETVVTSAGVVLPESSSEDTISFTQELAHRITGAAEVAETESLPIAPISTESEPALKPKAETPVDGLKLAAQPVVINTSQPTSEVQAAATPAAFQLPDVPALHQIIEKVSLITRQGETEVRLQLHPESLGPVLIQLHLTNGDVSVRMLTETVQAQNLIQDHLTQLKAAFTAQGLPLNNLAVGIGSDASAFDMQRRQPNDWSQEMAHQQASASTGEVNPLVSARSESRPWNGLHRVDYQV